jgi:hypothetical protein
MSCLGIIFVTKFPKIRTSIVVLFQFDPYNVPYFTYRLSSQSRSSDGRYYRKSIEIIDTYKSIDTFDTRKKYR